MSKVRQVLSFALGSFAGGSLVAELGCLQDCHSELHGVSPSFSPWCSSISFCRCSPNYQGQGGFHSARPCGVAIWTSLLGPQARQRRLSPSQVMEGELALVNLPASNECSNSSLESTWACWAHWFSGYEWSSWHSLQEGPVYLHCFLHPYEACLGEWFLARQLTSQSQKVWSCPFHPLSHAC